MTEPKSKLERFARKHPTLSVLGAAGLGLLGGFELAAGVLVGAGVVALLKRRTGDATTNEAHGDQMRQLHDRAPHGSTYRRAPPSFRVDVTHASRDDRL